MPRSLPTARTLFAAACVAIALAGCGSSSSPSTQQSGSGSSPWTPSPAGKWGTEPTVTFPSAAPPTTLVKEDLITGNGALAAAGDSVTVQYVGASYQIKKVFQASWSTPNGAFPFTLGVGQVIPGWDQGVAGMKVGGRRELIIPPALAYRASPPPGSGIPANETLIFIVDLLSVKPASGG